MGQAMTHGIHLAVPEFYVSLWHKLYQVENSAAGMLEDSMHDLLMLICDDDEDDQTMWVERYLLDWWNHEIEDDIDASRVSLENVLEVFWGVRTYHSSFSTVS